MSGATTSPKTGSPRLSASLSRAASKPGEAPSDSPTAAPPGGAAPHSPADAKAVAEAAAKAAARAETEARAAAAWRRRFDRLLWDVEAPAWLLSFFIHLVMFLLAALWVLGGLTKDAQPLSLLGGMRESEAIDDVPSPTSISLGSTPSVSTDVGLDNLGEETIDVPPLGDDPSRKVAGPVALGLPGLPNSLIAESAAMQSAGGIEGRLGDSRQAMVFSEGGTEESEHAVRRALDWLKAHQRSDGGWRFNLQGSNYCSCRHGGTASSTTAATGLALMAFLGAGQTQREGEYSEVVSKGVYYLLDRLQPTARGADLQEGTMYGQGIASIALCEAYALTNDPSLRPFAQAAVDFIVAAQDPKGGGWRYTPNEPGDTSMHGWQMMALRSAEMGYLNVPRSTFNLASHFLDGKESQRPYGYGYETVDDGTHATLAIGTLCRMYQGWPRNDSRLYRLVGRISEIGPSADDMYYNYYATQVVHHWGGTEWTAWNEKMREHLIHTQATQGHEAGSWQFDGNQGKVGGRLYNTAMAAMTLEVYYRHLPLYRLPSFSR